MSTYLAGFVEAVGRELDITRDQFEQARAQYLAIGDCISQRYEGHADVEIYSQGSFRLGTVVRPVVDRGDFDIDLVFLRQLQPGSISQQKLRDEAGELLSAYCEAHDLDEPLELGRCWRLDFFDAGFHLDVLPAIPHEDSATAIRLSDRDLHEWQYSNPIGYANWFSQRQNSALVDESRRELAKAFNVDVAEVPDFLIRTPLQRVVQVLKRSRDVYFEDDAQAPPSILITTLAAITYRGQSDLDQALAAVVSQLHQPIQRRNDEWWLPNPAHERENFADKWNADPERCEKYFEWLKNLRANLESSRVAASVDLAMDRLTPSFGASTQIAKTALIGDSQGSTRDMARGLSPAPDEQLPEDCFAAVLVDHSVNVMLEIAGDGGYARRSQLRRRRIPKHRNVRFIVTETTVPPPYDIYWKVRNHGEQAAKRPEQLRGSIVRGESVLNEVTAYRGEHYAECFIGKDGVVRARKRTWIPIS